MPLKSYTLEECQNDPILREEHYVKRVAKLYYEGFIDAFKEDPSLGLGPIRRTGWKHPSKPDTLFGTLSEAEEYASELKLLGENTKAASGGQSLPKDENTTP